MDKISIISMLVTFVTSNDVLKYEPQTPVGQRLSQDNLGVKWTPPKFCNGIDCPAYNVVDSNKIYEERIYPTSSWVSTNLEGIDYKDASRPMFWKLFKYISGENEQKEKIAMTCPVTTRIIPGAGPACESNFTMSFFISPSIGKAPQPSDKTVFIQEKSELHVFVRQFSGMARNFETWADQATILEKSLRKDGKTFEESYYFTAGYDAPYKLWNRHNEIWFLKK